MTVYGAMIPVTVVEDAMTQVLKDWLPSYLGEVERVTGRTQGSIAAPSYGIPQGDDTRRPEDQLPALSVISGGTIGEPLLEGNRLYSVADSIEVRVVVSANTADATNRLVKAYATAIAKCLVDKPPGDPVVEVVWNGNAYDVLPGDMDRSLLGATVRFTVYSENVLQRDAGPEVPEAPDPRDLSSDLPTVQTVGVVGQRLTP